MKEETRNMEENRVIYTDGRDVTVTDSTLHVKHHEYNLDGVTRCGMMTLKPVRTPGILLLTVGLLLIIAGYLNLITPNLLPDVRMGEQYVNANTLALWTGGALSLLGVLIIGLSKERYAVRIATAEGEKDALVSTKKEYISQIVDALNHAASYLRTKQSASYFKIRPAH